MKPLVGSRRLLGGEGTLLEDTMGSTESSSHFDSMAPMFLQSLAPSCTCLGKDSAAATRTPRAFQAREERARWPLSSGVRRWAWGSSSCRWRLPTAAWLSLGSWGWSSSETWVVPGWHAELLEMCPWVCSSFLQSTWERCICREAKKSMVRAGFPQGCSETQTSCQDPTHPWVPIQCSECPVHNLEQSSASPGHRKCLLEGPSVTPLSQRGCVEGHQILGHEGPHGIVLPAGPSQTQWCLPSTPKALVVCWC